MLIERNDKGLMNQRLCVAESSYCYGA